MDERAVGFSYPGDILPEDSGPELVASTRAIYLRLRLDDAKEEKSIRKAAVRSLHDGFVSCLMGRKHAADVRRGKACRSTADCDAGSICTEYDRCAPPPEPYNMRLAYRALRVLSNAWTDELHEADSELSVTAYSRDLEAVTRQDVPVAAQLIARAKTFVLVLDEDPKGGLPAEADAAPETEAERVQRSDHFARIGIWDIGSKKLLLRLRRRASARVLPVGEGVSHRLQTVYAGQRQANSCALALNVRHALKPNVASDVPDAGVGDAGDDTKSP